MSGHDEPVHSVSAQPCIPGLGCPTWPWLLQDGDAGHASGASPSPRGCGSAMCSSSGSAAGQLCLASPGLAAGGLGWEWETSPGIVPARFVFVGTSVG